MNYQETSREAWEAFVPVSAELDFAIMQALQEVGDDGLCDWEMEARLGRLHQAVSGNRRHLVERGLVVDSGKRRPKENGRNTIVWVLNHDIGPNQGKSIDRHGKPK